MVGSEIDMHSTANGMGSNDTSKHAKELADAVVKLGGSTKDMDDSTLLRFLRARSMNVAKAAQMLVEWQAWRALFVGPKGYIPDPEVQCELDTDKIALQGLSKRGEPLMIVFAGKHFPNNNHTLKRFVVHLLDKTIASARPGVEKMMVIIDLNHLGYKNLHVKGFIMGFQLLQNYYPERLRALYMVNTPKIFLTIWRIISRCLDAATNEKIVFLEDHKMSTVLLSEVDADTLPSIYGGNADIVLLQHAHVPNYPACVIHPS